MCTPKFILTVAFKNASFKLSPFKAQSVINAFPRF